MHGGGIYIKRHTYGGDMYTEDMRVEGHEIFK